MNYYTHKIYMDGAYPAIYIEGKNVHIHRLEWVRYNGEIPNGYVVHHKDGNKLNWEISNLELLSRSQHIKEHQNMERRKSPVIGYYNDQVYMFERLIDAQRFTSIYPSNIIRLIKQKITHKSGWRFERGI